MSCSANRGADALADADDIHAVLQVIILSMLTRVLALGLLTLLLGLLIIVTDSRHYHSTKPRAARALAGAIIGAVALLWAIIYAYKGLCGPTWAGPTAGAMLSACAGVLVGIRCLLLQGGKCFGVPRV